MNAPNMVPSALLPQTEGEEAGIVTACCMVWEVATFDGRRKMVFLLDDDSSLAHNVGMVEYLRKVLDLATTNAIAGANNVGGDE